jgi:hypothetical protein
MRKTFSCIAISTMLLSGLYAQEKLDINAINKIKKEGLENSKVMDCRLPVNRFFRTAAYQFSRLFSCSKLGPHRTGKMGTKSNIGAMG